MSGADCLLVNVALFAALMIKFDANIPEAQLENLTVPNEVIVFIADKIASNIRELEGALNRVIAYSSLTENEITVELASEALKDILSANKAKV